MNKLITTLEFWFDFTIGYMLTNPRKRPFYHRVMFERYGSRYCTQEQYDEYWESLDEETLYYLEQD